MRRRLALTALLCSALVLPISGGWLFPTAPTFAAQIKDCIVYVTPTGHLYHRATCSNLKGTAIRTSRIKALAHGLTACKVCGGSNCEK